MPPVPSGGVGGASVGWAGDVGSCVGATVGTGTVGTGTGTVVGLKVGWGIGTGVGEGEGGVLGAGVGGTLGAGDGGEVGTGLGAGVGENVATSTESAVALAIDSRRAERSSGSESRRRAAAVWIALVKLPSLTAAPSTAITCEWTEWSPLLPAYVLAMKASGMRTSLVTVMPVPSV